MIDLLDEALALKDVTRAGWLRVGVDNPESVAAHSWGICWLVIALDIPGIDQHKALKLAVVHDLAEARVGDITPHDGISQAEKQARERAAIESMLQDRPDLQGLWTEYDDGTSPEAMLVHDLDRLDMALQAVRYARTQGTDTKEFLRSARQSIHYSEVSVLLDRLE
jgi:putative hydrolase of HD superfamily